MSKSFLPSANYVHSYHSEKKKQGLSTPHDAVELGRYPIQNCLSGISPRVLVFIEIAGKNQISN